MIERFSKLTMENKVVCKVIDSEAPNYEKLGIMPWHHLVIDKGEVFVYIWDTRVIEKVLPENCFLQAHLRYDVIDNQMDLVVPFNADPALKAKCMEHKESMPIMFLGETLTEDEAALLQPIHY